MVDVVLATGRNMPRREEETPLLVAALEARGVSAVIEPWGTPASVDARLVVVRTTWDYHDNRDSFLDWVRESDAQTRLVNPLDVIVWNSHKSYLLDLAYGGVPVVPTDLLLKGATDADQISVLTEEDREVVIKPAVGVGAIGTFRGDSESPEAKAHLATLLAEGDALVQPYMPSVVDGEASLIYFDGHLSHAVRKVPAPGDYRVQTHLGGVVLPHTATDAQREVAVEALAALTGQVAYARIDLVDTVAGPVVMELELIEPELFLGEHPASASLFADHLVTLLA